MIDPEGIMEQDFTNEEKQQFIEEGLVEVQPGIWGYTGEHTEPNSKDYENMGTGYWIVGN